MIKLTATQLRALDRLRHAAAGGTLTAALGPGRGEVGGQGALGNVVGRIRRFGRVDPTDPVTVAEGIPDRLRSVEGYLAFDGSADGYQRYRADLGDHLEGLLGFRPADGYLAAVTEVLETTIADWFSAVMGVALTL